jgi:YidC/Oxa1 family membrane protein insertase
VRSLLIFIALFTVLVFGYPHVHRSVPHAAAAAVVRSQVFHPAIVKVSASAVAGYSVTPMDNFGWLTFIARPLYLALRFLHAHGIPNWGWAIITLTLLFNVLTVWPRVVSMKSSLKMMRIQPRVDAIKQRYAHLPVSDPKRAEMNVEMMALYKAEGASMFGGCLPMLLQMPLFFAFIKVLRSVPELHQAHWYWLTDLASPDPRHILPLLIIASMMLTQIITPAPAMTASQRWMLGILMPVVMGFSLWHYASGLSLYWISGNVISLLIQLAINRSQTGKEMNTLATERAATNLRAGKSRG